MASNVGSKLSGVVATIPQTLPKLAVNSAGDYLTTEYLSHGQRVTRLYKHMIRCVVDNMHIAPVRLVYPELLDLRFEMMKIRKAFDDNKHLDKEAAAAKLEEGEQIGRQMRAYKPYKYPHSPGGSCFARDPYTPDWIYDAWHPLEKAQYPRYFAKRELMKEKHIEWWNEKYGGESKA